MVPPGGVIKNLNLGLSVYERQDGRLRRIQVQPDDVVNLVDSRRVGPAGTEWACAQGSVAYGAALRRLINSMEISVKPAHERTPGSRLHWPQVGPPK